MKLFRALAVAGAGLAFALAILGSWVRINGAGLTCPDWPLCRGALVPALRGGVVLEWSHRAVALVLSLVLLATLAAGWRVRRQIAGLGQTLSALVAIFCVQVALGGATVFLANSPFSVMVHWGAAMALLAVLAALATLAVLAPPPGSLDAAPADDGAAPALAIAALLAFVTMCAGAYVSSADAGLACASVPFCDGSLFGHGGAQLAQMLHRLAAGTFGVIAAFATLVAWQSASRAVRTCASLGLSLVALQIALGIANVVWLLPTALREAHAANACATFLTFTVAAVLAALEPARARAAVRPAVLAATDGA